MTTAGDALPPEDRERLDRLRAADSLAELREITGAATEHEAYLDARAEWRDLQDRRLPPADPATDRLPGSAVVVDGTRFVVHGITHADTDAEREFLRAHVDGYLEAGATVYCEQGIREMYFGDMPDACAMDDYRWALQRCRELDVESHLDGDDRGFDGLLEDLASVTGTFREAVFSLVHTGSEVYGDRFAMALGDVATDFLLTHEDLARAREFEAFALSRRAAEDPAHLAHLQRYYETVFLPMPLEREWLRRHDAELEVVSHGRSERMADYAVFHADDAEAVHVVTGAAHQPGIRYYLERHRDGHRRSDELALVE